MNAATSVLPLGLPVAVLVVLAATGVVGWDVVFAVVAAVIVLALVQRLWRRPPPRTDERYGP
ncbi:hypothetical protein ACFQ34_30920 [Pseudonocardia benzenivorans]|jgi:hypothetical protein|uniref:Uncharacterized protein n=1 Tax=Pseudonocardia benzenivorans TaxID=228005 RepID=A0ABW3VTS1_9PSEU|nr:hypothetical protein [Pseudonocardia dioxanivorans]GJF02562.1 hypothetical protein PSD17_15250 [Pseudonocardia sp. D17]